MIAKQHELDALKKEVRTIKAIRAPGVLTSRTTAGVVRKVNGSGVKKRSDEDAGFVPRWG